jgi:putative aldouronate transport system substrate-binding protein
MKKLSMPRRVLSVLMVAAMTLSMVSCTSAGSKTSSATYGQTSTSSNPWSGLDLSKKETINCYVVGSQGTDWKRITNMAIAKIQKKINTTVNFVVVPWSDFQAKYTTFLAADNDVDIIYAAAWCNFNEYVHAGAFKSFNMSFVKKYMPLAYKNQAAASWKEATFNGKIYGIPNNTAYLGAGGIATTQDVLDKYHYKASSIKTVSDLNKFLLTIAAGKNNNGMYAINAQNSYPLDSNYLGNDAFSLDAGNATWTLYPYKKSKLNNTFNINNLQWFASTSAYKNFCLQMAKFNKAGVFPANIMSNSTMIDDNFSNGQSAINFSDPSGVNSARQNMKAKGKKVVYLDCTFTNESATMRGSYMGYSACFPASSKKMNRAATVMDCMKFDKDINRLLVGGIEGEHYKVDTKTNKRTLGPKASAYPWGGWFYLLQNQNEPQLKIDSDLQASQTRYDKAEVSRKNFPVIGFSYDNSKYQAEIAVLSSIFNEYRFSFCFGIFQDNTEAKLKEFISKCKAAGIDKIMADYKTQLQKYVKTNK